ncbi:Uncharacterized membrane protein [Pseudooceanicola antarcticus]|uniref:DUF1772 domain-containing protein n=1 Tax=Pseudooceanicola antarcticus TaxID=1247613 RepID=A0A285J3Y8_9RHOB|nr:anthrone oxygenase family protein [Pseudooceanicola antarcticus]PJE29666.1 DUF1772 domain-containing protein [Pseudooceanicola antarcticus]SNY54918.1 Uncharacterized membrane protein [Pseudooceanicola antarcticus]
MLIPLATGIASLLVSGVFLSFSDFIMRGFLQAPDRAGAAAMQGLNRTVYRSLFMVLLIGLVPLSALLALAGIMGLLPGTPLLVLAALLYLGGVMAVTGRGNVPMNQHLDGLSPEAPETRIYWQRYARVWTRLNHIRTASSFAAGLLWIAAALPPAP